MLKIDYIFGASDNGFPLDKSKLTGDVAVDSKSEYVSSLVAGKVAALDGNGNIKLCDGASDFAEGFIINDASGYFMENTPALASGVVPVLVGGGICETDQVVETDIKPGDKLYVGTGDNAGLLTKNDPTGDDKNGQVFAIARSGNSAANQTIKVRFL